MCQRTWSDESERDMTDALIDADRIIGERVVSFTVRGEWAHFRRVEANRTKMTYRLPPRTTIAGMLAAICGYDRDSYYGLFDTQESAMAIGIHPDHPVRTVSMPMLNLDTRQKGIRSVDTSAGTIRLPDPDVSRQRYAYEFVREPGYQVDVWLSEAAMMDELTKRLTEGRAQYAPTLGLSECLARIGPGEVEVSTIEQIDEPDTNSDPEGNGSDRDEYGRRIRGAPMIEIDSAVPTPTALVEQSGTSVVSERSAGWMEAHNGGRRTTGWIDWRLDPSGESLSVRTGPGSQVAPVRVGNRTVIMT